MQRQREALHPSPATVAHFFLALGWPVETLLPRERSRAAPQLLEQSLQDSRVHFESVDLCKRLGWVSVRARRT